MLNKVTLIDYSCVPLLSLEAEDVAFTNNSVYESWMSEECIKSLSDVLPIEHMKIINLR